MAENNRFAQLLQPIRDLAKLWQIDLVVELQRYVEELAQIQEEGVPEDSIPKYNFAEGALLLQGSTAIYSRKVEDLYDLVVRALDLLHSEKAAALAGKKGKAGGGGWAIPDNDELMTIDHLIKEGRNITVDSDLPEQRLATQRRVPLFLMPRNKEDRGHSEFRISACTVHPSGAYLLQESDSKLIDGDGLPGESQPGQAPLVPPPPKEVHDLDQQLQQLQEKHQQVIADHQMQLVSTPGPGQVATPAKSMGGLTPGPLAATPAGRTPIAKMAEQLAQSSLAPASDFWTLQDEHSSVGHDIPLEVGKACRRIQAAKKLLAGADALPQLVGQEMPSDEALWSGDAKSCASTLTTGDPVEQLFLAVGGQLKGCRFETDKAHFSPAWLEFEDLFSIAHNKWRQLRQASGSSALKPVEQEAEEVLTPKKSRPGEESDEEMGFGPDGVTPMKTPGEIPGVDAEHKRNVEKLEGMIHDAQQAIQDAQQKYEATIREHLQQITSAGGDSDSQRFPQLYAVVRAWQEQLEPVLKEFQSRPPFHIMEYSTRLLDKMVEDKESSGNQEMVFRELVDGMPRYEICRRFLTALFLTNQGNTDIVLDSEHDREGMFKLKVLKAEKEWISLEDEMEAAAAPRGRKRAKSAAPLADAENQEAAEPSTKRLTKKSRVSAAADQPRRASKSLKLGLRRKSRAERAGA